MRELITAYLKSKLQVKSFFNIKFTCRSSAQHLGGGGGGGRPRCIFDDRVRSLRCRSRSAAAAAAGSSRRGVIDLRSVRAALAEVRREVDTVEVNGGDMRYAGRRIELLL